MTDPNEKKIGFENLPNIYFKRLRTRVSSLSENVVVSGFFTIFDGKEETYWDDDEYFRSFLRIRLKVFKRSNAAGMDFQVGEDRFIYGPFHGNRPIPFAVEVSKRSSFGMYLSANLEMDLESIPDVDFNWTEDQWYRGPTTEERIFDNDDKILSMFRYVSGDNAHFGPVHIPFGPRSLNRVMKGSFHEDPTTGKRRRRHRGFLREDRSFNYKNYYVEDNFDQINIQRGFDVSRVPAVYMTNFASEQKSIYFHMFVSDSNLAVKTKVGRMLFVINPEYFRKINDKVEVRAVRIERERIENFEAFGPGPVPNSVTTLGSSQIYTEIVSDSSWPGERTQENYYSSNIDDREVKSKIHKHAFSINDDVTLYAITDYDVSAFDDEHIRYNARIDFVSLIDERLRDLMKEMRKYFTHLQSCYQTFYTNSEFYNHEIQMLTPLGFVELNKEYNYILEEVEDGLEYVPTLDREERRREAYWTRIPQLYSELIKFLERGNSPRQDYLTLFNLLNPVSASPETMATVILKISQIMSTIAQTYDIISSPAFSTSNLSLPSSPPDIYSYPYQSREVVEHPAYLTTAPQYDYLGDGPDFLGPNDGNNRTLFAGALTDRVNTELGEFAYNTPSVGPEDLPNYSERQITEINSNVGSHSFLTPRVALLQGQQVNLTSLDPEEKDKVKIFKAASSPKLGIKVVKPVKNLLDKQATTVEPNDVREYVGDDSLFALSTPDTLLKKIAKIKPHISTTALNFYSSKGRNFNLENIKELNLPLKQLPASVKKIFKTDFEEIDPFQNLQTRDAFFNRFFNVIQIYYLSDFETIAGNLLNLSKPIYKPISKEKLAATKRFLICKSEPINILSSLNSSYEEIHKKNIKNSVFIVKGGDIIWEEIYKGN